jgi:hypothetical protein
MAGAINVLGRVPRNVPTDSRIQMAITTAAIFGAQADLARREKGRVREKGNANEERQQGPRDQGPGKSEALPRHQRTTRRRVEGRVRIHHHRRRDARVTAPTDRSSRAGRGRATGP